MSLTTSVVFLAKLERASCPPELGSPGRPQPISDFYVICADVLALEAVAQHAEGPVSLSHSHKIDLHVILDFQILTFRAI